MSTPAIRVALIADLLSERWPSMDLVADMLDQELKNEASGGAIRADLLRPSLAGRGPGLGRYVNRYWDYPRWLRKQAQAYDLFHVLDHSYAHLVHVLPPHRTIVTCHDTDAFMPLVDSQVIPTRLPNVFTRTVLSGLRKSAFVTCDSQATLDEVRQFDFAPARKLAVVPVGVHPQLSAAPVVEADAAMDNLIGPRDPDSIELLHVGSCIPRKRIDLLLQVLDAVRKQEPRVRLLKAGGTLNAAQQQLACTLGVDRHIVQLPFLPTDHLAALYRRAAVALVTSEREGFGLPVVEALACGTSVVASDIPVLREVGGTASVFAPLDDVPAWRDEVLSLVRGAVDADARSRRRDAGLRQAAQFTWVRCAESMAGIYARVHAAARLREAA